MHPPLRPTKWDGKLEAFSRKLFKWFVVPVVCILLLHWWLEKCDCEDFCQQQGGKFVELDTGGRFNPMWVCVCDINGEPLRTAEW